MTTTRLLDFGKSPKFYNHVEHFPALMSFLRRPQSNFLRRAIFQIHLWVGIGVALYVVVIGLSGAALVFRPEFQALTFPEFFACEPAGSPFAEPDAVIRTLQARYPDATLLGIDYPTQRRGTFLAYLTRGRELLTVFSNSSTGEIIGEMPHRSWINVLQEIHFDLFAGTTGRFVNGVAAFLLIAMFATGLIVWWPGIDRWRQSLTSIFGTDGSASTGIFIASWDSGYLRC